MERQNKASYNKYCAWTFIDSSKSVLGHLEREEEEEKEREREGGGGGV
jgi:hypothetical protein